MDPIRRVPLSEMELDRGAVDLRSLILDCFGPEISSSQGHSICVRSRPELVQELTGQWINRGRYTESLLVDTYKDRHVDEKPEFKLYLLGGVGEIYILDCIVRINVCFVLLVVI